MIRMKEKFSEWAVNIDSEVMLVTPQFHSILVHDYTIQDSDMIIRYDNVKECLIRIPPLLYASLLSQDKILYVSFNGDGKTKEFEIFQVT